MASYGSHIDGQRYSRYTQRAKKANQAPHEQLCLPPLDQGLRVRAQDHRHVLWHQQKGRNSLWLREPCNLSEDFGNDRELLGNGPKIAFGPAARAPPVDLRIRVVAS